MTENPPAPLPVLKILLLALFVGAVLLLLRFSPLTDYLQPLALKEFIDRTGPLAPLLFILSYAVGVCLFLPALLFSSLGAVLFGAVQGYLCNIAGAMLGASGAFFIGRFLGRRLVTSLASDRLATYDQKIAENGFAVTLYLRLVFFPFTPMNFGMGLTKISFAHYFWGTLFGICAGSFALTFFFATLSEAWSGGQWTLLLDRQSLLALALFIASFFIPKIARKLPVLHTVTE